MCFRNGYSLDSVEVNEIELRDGLMPYHCGPFKNNKNFKSEIVDEND
jgi:hypothetical protein